MKINSIIDLVKDLDTSRQTKNLNKLLIRILLHLQVEFSITISTIYRILDSFCKANLLSLVFHPEVGKSYYDITVTEHHHIFEGESILDYMDEGLTELIRQYLKEKNFASVDISRIQVQITINNPKLNSKK